MMDLKQLQQMGTALLAADLKNRSEESLSAQLREFINTYVPIGVVRDENHMWYRARLCENNRPFDNLCQLIYPPGGSAVYGRASLRNSITLYGGWNQVIALAEIGANVGDVVQFIHYRTRVHLPQRCVFLGIYDHIAKYGKAPQSTGDAYETIAADRRNDPVRFAALAYVDSVISDFFRFNVSKEENYRYKLSALYANIFHENGFAGVIYPSVQRIGYNLAIDGSLFDTAFEVIYTRAWRIAEIDPDGIFKGAVLGASCEFAINGDIEYASKRTVQVNWTLEGGYKEINPQLGWRTPL